MHLLNPLEFKQSNLTSIPCGLGTKAMQNPLVEAVDRDLNQFGMSTAKLVYESYDSQNFGNAEATYTLGNLQFRFLRDRSDDTVSIGSAVRPQHFYYIEDVAVWMGWISLGELLKYDSPINFDEPPPGNLLGLKKALSLIARDLTQLDRAFSPSELMSTHSKLKNTERIRINRSGRAR